MTRLVLVAGAQELARDPLTVAWYDRELQALALSLSREPGSLLVTAGSPGPEVHAEMVAMAFGVTAVAYLPSGVRRVDGRPRGRWTDAALPSGAAAVVRRDAALIARAEQAIAEGWSVTCVAFLQPGANARSSSLTRVRLATEAGIPVWWGYP